MRMSPVNHAIAAKLVVNVNIVTGKLFFLGWIALAIAVVWIGLITGEWHYTAIFCGSSNSPSTRQTN
jgi:hypothetical protein